MAYTEGGANTVTVNTDAGGTTIVALPGSRLVRVEIQNLSTSLAVHYSIDTPTTNHPTIPAGGKHVWTDKLATGLNGNTIKGLAPSSTVSVAYSYWTE